MANKKKGIYTSGPVVPASKIADQVPYQAPSLGNDPPKMVPQDEPKFGGPGIARLRQPHTYGHSEANQVGYMRLSGHPEAHRIGAIKKIDKI